MTKSKMTLWGGIAGVVLIGVIAAVAFLLPRLSEASDIQKQADTVTAQNTTLAAAVDDLMEKEANLENERAVAAALAARVPATADQTTLFLDIRDAARRAGIPDSGVQSISPSVPQSLNPAEATPGADGIAKMDLAINVSAPYEQTVAFLRELESMPRSYLINQVNLSSDGESGDYRTSISGSLFVIQAPVDPAADAEATETEESAQD